MPVVDHDVHPLVRLGERPGCFNHKPYSPGYFAPDRIYRDDGTWESVQVFIPHRLSTECRFDQAMAGERCEGCEHIGSRYVQDMIRAAEKQKKPRFRTT